MIGVPKKQIEEIIQYLKTNKNNSIPEMAKKFKLSKSAINRVFDKYLKSLKHTNCSK